ncbi:MAG: hypothetical protein GXP02_00860 [Alphaproteobacteria bacterium]|nr:hypothetical protein [Alphaproteobacteria bacterium]
MDEDDDLEIDALADYPTLVLVLRFTRLIAHTDWFRYVGEPLEQPLLDLSVSYLDALGFPEVTAAAVEDWQQAADALETNDWNSPFWEVEQQLMAALTMEITDTIDPELLQMVLTRVTSVASEYVGEGVLMAAERWGITDEELMKAAIGEGVQACYQAALVIAAGVGDDHPFTLKYQFFESGWWPLGIMGTTFNIF